MSDHGSEPETNSNAGQISSGEQELASRLLQIQHKRFYLDVKQNHRGRFFKVAEVGAGGRKSRLLLAMSTAAEFRDHLTAFNDHYSHLGPIQGNNEQFTKDTKNSTLKTVKIEKDNRRYFLDLKENEKGRFLRVSQTIPKGAHRSQIAIPAQGLIEFRDTLTDLLEEFAVPECVEDKSTSNGMNDSLGSYRGELPESQQIRCEKKKFFFDIKQNNLGVYMRISEVKNAYRSAITIPLKSWPRFRDVFADYIDKVNVPTDDKNSGGNNSASGNSGMSPLQGETVIGPGSK